ncbi:MAG: hypothetical protein RR513_09390 [Muribaculaceae bacterium]
MAIQKFYIAFDCETQEEADAAQEALKRISNMRILTAKKIITYYPILKSKEKEIKNIIRIIANGGVKALMSYEGALNIKSLKSK